MSEPEPFMVLELPVSTEYARHLFAQLGRALETVKEMEDAERAE